MKGRKYLLVGPRARNGLGGATILFENQVKFFLLRDIGHEVIDTHRCTYPLWNLLRILLVLLWYLPHANIIVVNVSQRGTKYLFPAIFCIARLFRRKVIYRVFGGSLVGEYRSYGRLQRLLFERTNLKADLFAVETKAISRFFERFRRDVYWFPNCRFSAEGPTKGRRRYAYRFVFIGQIKESKGVGIILEALKTLPEKYTVDLYGPVTDSTYCDIGASPNYQGVIRPEELNDVLNLYDVLVLPSHYEGEGYPGVIIEAFSMGIPVITTKWSAIPELVVDGETGYLIDIRSSDQLIAAMYKINSVNYPDMSRNATTVFEKYFEADKVHQAFIDTIDQLEC